MGQVPNEGGLQCLSAVCLSGSGGRMHRDCIDTTTVSNAFRLCAYPAGPRRTYRTPRPTDVSNAFRLCAYPAVNHHPTLHERHPCRLQCLSAVCLSGRTGVRQAPEERQPASPMPFGCVPIRQIFIRW